MISITDIGTMSVLKRRMERRVCKKLCSSVAVEVKAEGFNPIDDPSLSLAIGPGFVIVFEGELVNVLICTFSCKSNDFTAHAEIAFLFIRVLDHHGHS